MGGRSSRGLVKKRADLVRVLEALYAPESDEAAWARGVSAEASTVLADPTGVGMTVVAHTDDFQSFSPVLVSVLDASIEPAVRGLNEALPSVSPDFLRAFYFPGAPVTTHHEIEAGITTPMMDTVRTYRTMAGIQDACGIFAYPEPGLAAVMFWGSARSRFEPEPEERLALRRVAVHLDAALRLRLRPEVHIAAVLAPDGMLLDLEDTDLSPRRAYFASQVVSIERSRLRARRREPDAVDQWRALVDGRYTLVPREDRDGKRYYLLAVNPSAAVDAARFSAREQDVVRLAARGFAGKEIAYGLGVSQAVVSEALARAAAKLGLRSRVELVHVASSMFGPRPEGKPEVRLSAAEREVLELLRRGLSNAEIARLRARSERTIANQIASLLAKTGSPSRRALAAHDGAG